jgi:hypothetical protein
MVTRPEFLTVNGTKQVTGTKTGHKTSNPASYMMMMMMKMMHQLLNLINERICKIWVNLKIAI